MAVLEKPTSYQLRSELEGAFFKELLGPAGGPTEEVNEMRVSTRYLLGMLAPKKRSRPGINTSTSEQLELGEEANLDISGEGKDDDITVAGSGSIDDGSPDLGAPQRESLFPSSFGMTFCVDGKAEGIVIRAGWGRYTREKSETITSPKTGDPLTVWKRTPISGKSNPVRLKDGLLEPWMVTKEHPDVLVVGKMRKRESDWIVTLFLVNGQQEPLTRKDEAWLFQTELSVEATDSSPIFVKRRLSHDHEKLDAKDYKEQAVMDMLYRDQVEFAVGHGIALHADLAPGDPQHAVRISTRAIPRYEVPLQTPPSGKEIPELQGLALDMKELAELPGNKIVSKLQILANAYKQWIKDGQTTTASHADGITPFAEVAKSVLKDCEGSLQRIQEGIALLGSNNHAFAAFRFANKAMWQQRIHSILAERVRRGQKPELNEIDIPTNRTWYPFQLAFILLNLPSVTDIHHKDRSHETQAIADLLWFPTGGGKTEAYLGLAAYVMAMRRLQGVIANRVGESGVAVLMRYTLRLLTLQQFQRASALICACEMIRRDDEKIWGKEPFRIGLWVGYRTTPNTTEQSSESIKRDHGQFRPGSGLGSPHQLTNCPWCGTPIDPGKNIRVETYAQGRCRTFVYCGDTLGRCPFTEKNSPDEGIPILLVDEEIYRRLPTLLIATVDKFAQMPWKGQVQMLFGEVNGHCPRHGFRSPEINDTDSHQKRGSFPAVKSIQHPKLRPPDLIIQDELHLISGPLGTLVGLYETAIDELASWQVDGKRVRPKVIASTATIRRASDQVKHVFLRDVNIFPPQGLHIKNNFFSIQHSPSPDRPGRLYLGISAPGLRLKVALIRVYTALLAAAQQLYEKYGEAADPYMTLVGYFGSLQELGGMVRLVEDDVRTRLQDMDKRGLAKRGTPLLKELTSRIRATAIPEILDLLEADFHPEKQKERDAQKKAGKRPTILQPIDVLLATNMISVGVDVKRLGLMTVSGQPKTTAEYIQATSRIGRQKPGLVVTVYNWARPRDLSHYETFEHYHATFYKHVEALSVTPFSKRALDRALTAILVSLLRLEGDDFNENKRAQTIARDHPLVTRAFDAIVARAVGVVGLNQLKDDIVGMLKHRMDVWLKEAEDKRNSGGILGYEKENDGRTVNLLEKAGFDKWGTFTCLNSLRDVEPSIGLVLDDRNLDD